MKRFCSLVQSQNIEPLARAFSSSSERAYQLLTWGRGEHGNLGHGNRETRWEPKAVEFPSGSTQIVSDGPPSVSCGFVHTSVIAGGKMYSFGKGGGGRLGSGRDRDAEFPTEVLFPPGVRPVSVTCGGIHTGAIDEVGRLWMWGYAGMGSLGAVERKGSFFGTLLAFVQGQHKVKVIWPHESHGPWSIGIDINELQRVSRDLGHSENTPQFTYDYRMYLPGHLAEKRKTPLKSLLQLAESFKASQAQQRVTLGIEPESGPGTGSSRGEVDQGLGSLELWDAWEKGAEQGMSPPPADPVVQVSCGGAHTLAASSSGRLYAFGYDEGDGRMGVVEKWQEGPRRVHFEGRADLRVRAVAAGHKHTAVIDTEGSVWTFGANQGGELGTGKADRGGPFTQRLDSLRHENVVQVACGAQHTVVLTASGRVYGWGSNAEGQLGLGERAGAIIPTPTLIKPLKDIKVKQVVCGGRSTFVLTEGGEVLSWGLNLHGSLALGYDTRDERVVWEPRAAQALAGAQTLSLGTAHGAAWIPAPTPAAPAAPAA